MVFEIYKKNNKKTKTFKQKNEKLETILSKIRSRKKQMENATTTAR